MALRVKLAAGVPTSYPRELGLPSSLSFLIYVLIAHSGFISLELSIM